MNGEHVRLEDINANDEMGEDERADAVQTAKAFLVFNHELGTTATFLESKGFTIGEASEIWDYINRTNSSIYVETTGAEATTRKRRGIPTVVGVGGGWDALTPQDKPTGTIHPHAMVV